MQRLAVDAVTVLRGERLVPAQPVLDAAAAAVRRPLLLELLVGAGRAVRRPALPLFIVFGHGVCAGVSGSELLLQHSCCW